MAARRAALEPARLQQAWAAGRALDIDKAIAYALLAQALGPNVEYHRRLASDERLSRRSRVNAQVLGGTAPMNRVDLSICDLMLNFTPEDLEANRRGLLTPAQRQTLDAFARHQTNWTVVYMIGGPLIVAMETV